MKLSLVTRAIRPEVLPSAVEFAAFVLAAIFVAVDKDLHSEAFLDGLQEGAEIVLLLGKFEEALTLFPALPPFSTVEDSGCCVEIDPAAIFEAVGPLPIIDVSVGLFEDSAAVSLSCQKLSFVDVFSWYKF